MTEPLTEQEALCPFCGEPITLLIDVSAGGQQYIEDCEVCCQPMQVRFGVEDETLTSLDVERGD